MNEQISKFAEQLTDGTIVTGGHFLLLDTGVANLNDGTIRSFETAVETYKEGKNRGLKVALGLLINNMGGVCDAKKKTCMIPSEKVKEEFVLPVEYRHILDKFSIKDAEVKIYWEKTLRNRGDKELERKIEAKADYLELMEGAYWFVSPKDGRKIILSRATSVNDRGIPACPLIMSTFAHDLQEDGFPSSLNFYYVDLDNEENIPNYFPIEKGRIVAESFYEGINISNVYLLKDRIITSFDLGKV